MIDMHAHWRPAELADALRARTRGPRILRNPDGAEVPLAKAFDDVDLVGDGPQSVSAVILTGAGRAFSSGGDQKRSGESPPSFFEGDPGGAPLGDARASALSLGRIPATFRFLASVSRVVYLEPRSAARAGARLAWQTAIRARRRRRCK